MSDTLFNDAVKAYSRYCSKHGLIFDQPSELYSDSDEKYIYLSNSHGLLAQYDIDTRQISIPEDE